MTEVTISKFPLIPFLQLVLWEDDKWMTISPYHFIICENISLVSGYLSSAVNRHFCVSHSPVVLPPCVIFGCSAFLQPLRFCTSPDFTPPSARSQPHLSFGASLLLSDSYEVLIGMRNMRVKEKGDWDGKRWGTDTVFTGEIFILKDACYFIFFSKRRK